MADYPSYTTGIGSRRTLESRHIDDFASSGTMHSRLMHSKQYFQFSVIHPGLTGVQYQALKDLYESGPRDTWTNFTWHNVSPAEVYSVIFTGPPQTVVNHGNNLFDVRVELRGWVP